MLSSHQRANLTKRLCSNKLNKMIEKIDTQRQLRGPNLLAICPRDCCRTSMLHRSKCAKCELTRLALSQARPAHIFCGSPALIERVFRYSGPQSFKGEPAGGALFA